MTGINFNSLARIIDRVQRQHPPEQVMIDGREELIGQLADEIGRLGMCSTADSELFERVIDAGYRKQVAP